MISDISSAVSGWLSGHHGVISSTEATRLGLSRGQISLRTRTGEWEQVARGVYGLAGSPTSPFRDLRAAVLASGPDACASHRSAAWLWGITDEPEDPTVTIPHARPRNARGVRIVRSRIPVRIVVRRRIPCSEPVRTMLDCATQSSSSEIDDLMDRALARRVLRIDDLVKAVDECADLRRHPGRPRLADRLARRGITGAPAPSVLESRMARLLAAQGVPAPKAELVWGPQRRYRLDYAYPAIKLAVEVDGHAFHFTPEQQRWDHRRSNALTAAGWTVLPYNWWDVTYEARRVAAEIAGAYRMLAA